MNTILLRTTSSSPPGITPIVVRTLFSRVVPVWCHAFDQAIDRMRVGARVLATVLLALLLAACAGGGAHRQHAQPLDLPGEHRGNVVLMAMGLMQTQYRYGGAHPNTGFDCSGLVAYVFHNATGQQLPHNTAAIAALTRPVGRRALQAGDFVFFNTLGRPYSHMGIYLGEGRFINAPSSGGSVRIDHLDNPYYKKTYQRAGTVFRS